MQPGTAETVYMPARVIWVIIIIEFVMFLQETESVENMSKLVVYKNVYIFYTFKNMASI